MSWITLAESHVLDRLSSDEIAAIEAAGEDSPTDRLAGILSQVSSMVRGKVAACDDNLGKMGAAGTIPEELLWAAATLARDSLVASLPVSSGDTEERRTEARNALEMLNQAARCEIRIADDSDEIAETVDGGAGDYGGDDILSF